MVKEKESETQRGGRENNRETKEQRHSFNTCTYLALFNLYISINVSSTVL